MKKVIALTLALVVCLSFLCGCEVDGQRQEIYNTQTAGNNLMINQPTPTDLEYSLERYNLIRRAYWVNGMKEKARNLPCEVEKPLSYVVLLLDGVGIVGKYVVDGKISSLNSFLSPDSEEYNANYSEWLPDVDGSFGENSDSIFFFTPEGNYMEWNGRYLYSDIPFELTTPVLVVGGGADE